ncbi:MAG: hypothetical protein AB4352_20715 [Hormoscilla sp.]
MQVRTLKRSHLWADRMYKSIASLGRSHLAGARHHKINIFTAN